MVGGVKKVLVLGGTGCIGAYLVEKLIKRNYAVDAVTLEAVKSENPKLRYLQKNAMDECVLKELLQTKYDAIVDFMWYDSSQFALRAKRLLENTEHYIALSSYRVYAESASPLNEQSERLLERITDEKFLNSDDYAQAKCRIEDWLKTSAYRNWTIVRPVVVYGGERLPVVATSFSEIQQKLDKNVKISIPKLAMDKTAAVVWAGDVAEMIARLLFKAEAYGETYLLGSSEQVTWREICGYYTQILGVNWEEVATEEFFQEIYGNPNTGFDADWAWIYLYDRFYDRKIDNFKVLKATGLEQKDLKSPKAALEYELRRKHEKN